MRFYREEREVKSVIFRSKSRGLSPNFLALFDFGKLSRAASFAVKQFFCKEMIARITEDLRCRVNRAGARVDRGGLPSAAQIRAAQLAENTFSA
jgi:hypothetical protein